jgi:hypothetical protein
MSASANSGHRHEGDIAGASPTSTTRIKISNEPSPLSGQNAEPMFDKAHGYRATKRLRGSSDGNSSTNGL